MEGRRISRRHLVRGVLGAGAALTLGGCGSRNWFGGTSAKTKRDAEEAARHTRGYNPEDERGSSLLDLFTNRDDPNTTLEVNKYIWNASLEILNFLPIETADPFSGVIVTGYGTPPGGGRPYKATVLVQDPALDARSLKLAMMTRGGPVSPATVRAVEDAILTRARQLRIRDGKL